MIRFVCWCWWGAFLLVIRCTEIVVTWKRSLFLTLWRWNKCEMGSDIGKIGRTQNSDLGEGNSHASLIFTRARTSEEPFSLRICSFIGVFPPSGNSENLINHWNSAQFKDPVSHMCRAGAGSRFEYTLFAKIFFKFYPTKITCHF